MYVRKCVAPCEIFKYSHYVFAQCTSHVAPHMAISCVVIPHVANLHVVVLRVVIPQVPCYIYRSMTISYVSNYYTHLPSSYVRAGHTQLESVINLQNPPHHCERSMCKEYLSYSSNVLITHILNLTALILQVKAY